MFEIHRFHSLVSHTHMDHFVGFARLLRTCLGRERPRSLYGPDGVTDRVEHELAAFTWNLVERYGVDLGFSVHEVTQDGVLRRATFNSRERFVRRDLAAVPLGNGPLFVEPTFDVRCTMLDHDTPCLAFAVQEAMHVNVWRNRLADLGVEAGPWLREAKRAVLAGAPDDTRILARRAGTSGTEVHEISLGAQRSAALQIVPGQKIAYVTDAAYHADNVNQDDHVSMATFAARRLQPMIANTAHILAIELLASAQGVEFLRPLTSSTPLESALAALRSVVPALAGDRYLAPDIEVANRLVHDGTLASAFRSLAGLPALWIAA